MRGGSDDGCRRWDSNEGEVERKPRRERAKAVGEGTTSYVCLKKGNFRKKKVHATRKPRLHRWRKKREPGESESQDRPGKPLGS